MDAIKAAKNQALFREVNERIRNLDYSVPRAAFVCECVRPECSETIEMSLAEYEEIRRVPNHFLVAAGKDHFFPDVERTSIHIAATGWWRSSASRKLRSPGLILVVAPRSSAQNEKVVEFFLEREARGMISEVREDEPLLAEELRVEAIEL
jgi:hypothetical protein